MLTNLCLLTLVFATQLHIGISSWHREIQTMLQACMQYAVGATINVVQYTSLTSKLKPSNQDMPFPTAGVKI